MNDLHIVPDSPSEIQSRTEAYIERCGMIITNVFRKSHIVRSEFDRWFNGLVSDTKNEGNDPVLLLHNNPLYLVAEYLGVDIRYIEDGEIAIEYRKLARRMNWNGDTP
jgi:hypothetical protein